MLSPHEKYTALVAAAGYLPLTHSGINARRGLREAHYDSYDVSRVFVRTQEGWLAVP